MNRTSNYKGWSLIGLILLSLISVMSAQAKQIDLDEATAIAESFFNSRIRNGAKGAVKAQSVPMEKSVTNVSSEPAYFVFTPEDARGFVIVSADDNAAPIVGYSLDAKFDGEKLPDALKAYLSDYSQVVKAISEGRIEYKPQSKGGTAVAPLLKVKWNQSEPYNLYAPEFGDTQAPSGCVATAMAQVMKYYEFPPKGNGTVSCSYGSQELGHPYDWSNMLDEYTGWDEESYNWTVEQGQAVATLMRDIGYSVDMNYGRYESEAAFAVIASAMCNHFNYSPEIRFRWRNTHSTQAWIDEIRENLLRGEPVLYGGTDGSSGHEFVCDGIDADDFLHINWGWGGISDGYFDVNILSPDNLGIGAGSGAYFRDQNMVVNIRPGEPAANYLSTRIPLTLFDFSFSGTLDEEGKVTGDKIELSARYLNSSGAELAWSDYSFGIAVRNNVGEIIGIYGVESVYQGLPEGYYVLYRGNVPYRELISNGQLTDGRYTLSVVCVRGDIKNPTKDDIVPLSAGDLNNVSITVRNGEIYVDNHKSLTDEGVSFIRILDGAVDGKIYQTDWIKIALTMENTGTQPIQGGYVRMYMVPEAADKDNITMEELEDNYRNENLTDIYLYPGVAQTMPCKLYLGSSAAPGRYRIYAGRYDSATGGMVLVETEKPIYIDVIEMPQDKLVITSTISNRWPQTARSELPYVDIEFEYYNTTGLSRFNTELQVWCRKKGVEDESEFFLFRGNHMLVSGERKVQLRGWGEQWALWFDEIGTEYEARIKFLDREGNLRVLEGNNKYEFTLVEDDSDVVIEFSDPMVINGGKPVEAKDGTTFEAVFEISSPKAMTIDPEQCYMEIKRGYKDKEKLNSFDKKDIQFDKTEVAAGEKVKGRVTFEYHKRYDEPDLAGSTLHVVPWYFYVNGSYYGVQMRPYLESAAFEFVGPVPVSSITLSETEVSLPVNGSVTITAQVAPAEASDKSVVWSTSNAYIATVDEEGKVTAIAVGEAVITATAADGSGVKAACAVKVVPTPVESVKLDKESIELIVNQSAKLSATIFPEDATNKTVLWGSSDGKIASVDKEGNVTALSVGEVTITAAAIGGTDISASCKVKVLPILVTAITLNETEVSLRVNGSVSLSAKVTPDDATDGSVVWATSDANIATVDENGKVTAVALGEAVITATAADGSGIKAECVIKVVSTPVSSITLNETEVSLRVNGSVTLTATLPADATYKAVTWFTSDAKVATVDENGKVTAVALGTAVITATAADGSGAKADCVIKVVPTLVSSITLNEKEVTLHVDRSVTLTAEIAPADATDKAVVWSTSNAKVATVDENGKVTAVAPGSAVITAAAADGSGAKAECIIKVISTSVASITLSETEVFLHVNGSVTLTAEVAPADATDKAIVWTAFDDKIATVDESGKVTAVALGTTSIIAAAADGSGAYAVCFVYVVPVIAESITLSPSEWSGYEGSTFTITAEILPADVTDPTLSWSSSDRTVATVNDEGVVSVLKPGSCVITASTTDGSALSATCVITSSSGINAIFNEDDGLWDVYNVGGTLIIKDGNAEQLRQLSPGIYIFRQGLKTHKIVIR